MTLHKRLKEIRDVENLTQKKVAEMLSMATRDYQDYEYGVKVPGGKKLQIICNDIFPNYALYLMTGTTAPPEQISPDMKAERDQANKRSVG
jgi:transcriptional regulator with XRE-family HTH domain